MFTLLYNNRVKNYYLKISLRDVIFYDFILKLNIYPKMYPLKFCFVYPFSNTNQSVKTHGFSFTQTKICTRSLQCLLLQLL